MLLIWTTQMMCVGVRASSSANGTFVNGMALASGRKTKLKPGDTISFGPEPVFIVLRNIFAHA